jgi:membrane-associated phospholipid phosphatase
MRCSYRVRRAVNPLCYVALVSVTVVLILALLLDSTELWIALTSLGEEVAYVGLALAVVYLLDPLVGLLTLGIVLLSGSTNILLKYSLNIPRPPPEYWRVPAEGPGFPSGHTQVSASFWSGLAVLTPRKCTVPLALVIPVAVASSRVALGVHSIADVAGGYAIGVAISVTSAYLERCLGRGSIPLVYSLALAASSISSYLGYDLRTSSSTLGLSLGLLLLTPRVKHFIRSVHSMSLTERFLALVTSATMSLSVLYLSRPAGYVARASAYLLLALALYTVPVAFRRVRAGALRDCIKFHRGL